MRSTIERLRAEFLEMPRLRLNAAQIQRLCGVEHTMCQDAIDTLVDVKFLRANPDPEIQSTSSRPRIARR